ncbi:MAG: response regulator transcription factor [Flavobacterium sp.]|nr:MAG: response regulator transcription factor [Flavobacterium sp.]
MKINVAIADDQRLFRKGMIALVNSFEEVNIIFEAENGKQLVDLVANEEQKPNVILLDLSMPEMNGLEALKIIKENHPSIGVIILTIHEAEHHILATIQAGANGYLLKKDSPQKILDAIEAIYNGESAMNGIIAAKLLEYFQKQGIQMTALEELHLTTREKAILQMLVKGMSYKEIAGDSFISVETLNSHIKNIYRKLNVHSRSELAAKYGRAL